MVMMVTRFLSRVPFLKPNSRKNRTLIKGLLRNLDDHHDDACDSCVRCTNSGDSAVERGRDCFGVTIMTMMHYHVSHSCHHHGIDFAADSEHTSDHGRAGKVFAPLII